VNHEAVLAAYDEQVRRRPTADGPDVRVERADGVVRTVSSGGGWTGVTWSDLNEVTADTVIAAQVDRFTHLMRSWEWKHYSYDLPPDLPQRLRAAGLTPEPVEALLVAEIADLALDVQVPAGVRLLPVVDAQGVSDLVRVHEEVFGGDHDRGPRWRPNSLSNPRLLRPWSPSSVGLRWRPDGWSCPVAASSPACGAAGRCPRGAAAACFAASWPTVPRWLPLPDSAICRSTRPRTANRSCGVWVSSSSRPRPRSRTPAEPPDVQEGDRPHAPQSYCWRCQPRLHPCACPLTNWLDYAT